MIAISILMPVYNSELFLHGAISSVLKQSFTNWELLCVDDGSSDGSLKILRNYSDFDRRIKYFSQPNQGPLAARRLGFENSSGAYIIYLDSDDEYSSDLLESLYERALETDADSIAPDMISKGLSKSVSWNAVNCIDKNEILSGLDGFVETFPWRKLHNFNLWKRNVFEKSTYHPYLENNNFNADEILQRILLLNCKRVVFSKSGAYIRNHNESSITNVLQLRSFNRLDANEKLIQLGIDYNLSEDIMMKIYSFSLFCQLKGLLLAYYSAKNSFSKNERKQIMGKMSQAYNRYSKAPMNMFYGASLTGRTKQQLQISSFIIFKLMCYIQSNVGK